ncbi:glutamate-cysteine ligase [Limosilactobacillus frumenti DSM 13145]|uniref:Glutamate--cysteine ligase n=1 Tax=Limosilactobacillus frumenti DSM 13145 TaxID=1423746 RepID=A0A0R1P0I4_9LACO|nr:hypothetical protein [Limosilactobacillus frumenti]KRL26023.1 glutamate-cysteine ligase [Limosilactobacillus frumenti DSM 13145]MBA2913967.1 glutamate--cysteine ligase [Limosilactobacillus frumenti]QFG71970.1 glutamate--cysteine ligase [Limosilactobacillus frumenti]
MILSSFGKAVMNRNMESLLFSFPIGLEVERQRIDADGRISQFPYPYNIGDPRTNKWITTDFMETMAEIATPIAKSPEQALRYLERISNILRRGLADGEYLWPLSMPPKLPKDHRNIRIAHHTLEKKKYSEEWLKRHKIQEGAPCGVHVNISIAPSLLNELTTSIAERNQLYIKVAQGFLTYRFFLTYLFGASPLAEENYFMDKWRPRHLARSIRQSKYGFGTKFDGDFSDTEQYVQRIHSGLQDGQLLAEHDFHSPVRLKGPRKVAQLPTKGTQYLELRMLDLNPWASIGIDNDVVDLLCLMMAYFLMSEEQPFSLTQSNIRNEQVALEKPTDHCQYEEPMRTFLKELEHFAATIQAGQGTYDLLKRLEKMIDDPQQTFAGRLSSYIHHDSLSEFALQQAINFQSRSQKATNVCQQFKDDQVLSEPTFKEILGN